jgi:tetratricopeptide (TPR) repeat protein
MRTSMHTKFFAVIVVGVGVAAATLAIAQDGPKTGFDPLFDALSNCFKPKQANSAWMRQLAQNKTSPELRPVDRPQAASAEESAPPLWGGLGGLHYPISTNNAQAQAYFNQGLRLAYAFNHGEALRAFRQAQRLDSGCAMCYWGEALVLGPNINAPMDPSAAQPAWQAIENARAQAKRANARERALIEALARRYSPELKAERAELDSAYADAMAVLHRKYPTDTTIATLYAESLMDLQPWDYWEPGGVKAKGRAKDIVPTLEKVLRQERQHPGAIHFYIHAVEASNRPERAEPYAEKLAGLMPGAGHIVHMPSHIYYRVGRYLDALEANRQAVAVDERYFTEAKASDIYAVGYYPHNIHFLMASAQMAGDGRTAVQAAEKLARAVPEEALPTIAMVHPVKAAPYFAHAQFSTPTAILALPAPSENFPYIRALWHYARGVAYAQMKAIPEAEGEARAIAAIGTKADFKMLNDAGIPAADVVAIAERVVWARIAQAQGHSRLGAQHLREAIVIEDRLAYMEPPYWAYPIRQSLGAVLLASGDLDGAEQALRESLRRTPNNAVVLYALSQVYTLRGDKNAAEEMEGRFKRAWAGDGPVDLAAL